MKQISRRSFMKLGAMSAAYLAASSKGIIGMSSKNNGSLRLGGPVFKEVDNDPAAWVQAHKEWGYSAAYCPVDADAPGELIKAFESEAAKHNLIIAEVGAWSNPISPDEEEKKKAVKYCCTQLDLADRIGANCCVNIAGSRNPEQWDAPHKDNLSRETFDMIVEVTREIIDTVKPTRTYWALETMPYVFPYSVDSYLELIKKIDRDRFAAHFDPVNLMNSPENYFYNGNLIKEAFNKFGRYIKSCHAKDTILLNELTFHTNEIRPGLGNLDYPVYLKELSKLDNVPLMLEHLEWPEDYKSAAEYVKKIAGQNNIELYNI
jgi:sugar phosphate isomerase/epimerase